MSSPVTVGRELRSQLWHSYDTCGKTHQGPYRWGQDGCYKCGQLGHYLKDCPQRNVPQSVPPASQSTVQMERPREVGPSPAQGSKDKVPARVFTLNL